MIARLILAVTLLIAGPVWAQSAPQQEAGEGALERLAQDVTAAQQVGTLAAGKNLQVDYALLGDQMALANARINEVLDQMAGQDVERFMDEQSRERFESMSDLNQEEFADQFLAFIGDVYPRIIDNIEALAQQQPDAPGIQVLAQEAVPALREQLGAAEQLAQTGQLDEEQRAEMNRGPLPRKDDPDVIPDTTPPIDRDFR